MSQSLCRLCSCWLVALALENFLLPLQLISTMDTRYQDTSNISKEQPSNAYKKRSLLDPPVSTIESKRLKDTTTLNDYTFLLRINWHFGPSLPPKVVTLPLSPIASLEQLTPFQHRLLLSAFSEANRLPDYLTDDETFYRFTPTKDFLSLPEGDAVKTEFQLIAQSHSTGSAQSCRERLIVTRALHARPDPERRLLVTVAEFESDPRVLDDGETEVIVTLMTIPTISVERRFLDEEMMRLFFYLERNSSEEDGYVGYEEETNSSIGEASGSQD